MSGWIKVHRSLLKWEWYDDVNTWRLFMHLLLRANHEDKKWRGQTIKRGQILTGRKALSAETGLSEKTVRTSLKKLEMTNEVAIKSTSKYSIITITKWNDYQDRGHQEGQQTGQQRASKGPAKGQQRATNKNEKNYKNYKKERSIGGDPAKEAFDLYNDLAKKIDLPVAMNFSNTRKGKIRQRLKDSGGMDGWVIALEKLEASSFCRGSNGGWVADLDFILQEKSFNKLMEGSYDDRKSCGVSKSDLMEAFERLETENEFTSN